MSRWPDAAGVEHHVDRGRVAVDLRLARTATSSSRRPLDRRRAARLQAVARLVARSRTSTSRRYSSVSSSSQRLSPSRVLVASTKSRMVCLRLVARRPRRRSRQSASAQRTAATRATRGTLPQPKGARVELEHDPGDLHVVAGLEAGRLERPDHADRAQALLHVAQRLLVARRRGGRSAARPAALTRKAPGPRCSHAERVARARAGRRGARRARAGVRLGRHRLGHARGRSRRAARRAPRRSPRRSTNTGDRRAASPPLRSRPPPASLRRHQVGLRQAQHAAAGRPGPAPCSRSSASTVAWFSTGSEPSSGREVEHVHQQPAALHVGEELVAEPGAGAGALDQPGDVGEHELAVVPLDRAEHRLERRERVVGHLRAARASSGRAATTCRRSAAPPGRRRRAA